MECAPSQGDGPCSRGNRPIGRLPQQGDASDAEDDERPEWRTHSDRNALRQREARITLGQTAIVIPPSNAGDPRWRQCSRCPKCLVTFEQGRLQPRSAAFGSHVSDCKGDSAFELEVKQAVAADQSETKYKTIRNKVSKDGQKRARYEKLADSLADFATPAKMVRVLGDADALLPDDRRGQLRGLTLRALRLSCEFTVTIERARGGGNAPTCQELVDMCDDAEDMWALVPLLAAKAWAVDIVGKGSAGVASNAALKRGFRRCVSQLVDAAGAAARLAVADEVEPDAAEGVLGAAEAFALQARDLDAFSKASDAASTFARSFSPGKDGVHERLQSATGMLSGRCERLKSEATGNDASGRDRVCTLTPGCPAEVISPADAKQCARNACDKTLKVLWKEARDTLFERNQIVTIMPDIPDEFLNLTPRECFAQRGVYWRVLWVGDMAGRGRAELNRLWCNAPEELEAKLDSLYQDVTAEDVARRRSAWRLNGTQAETSTFWTYLALTPDGRRTAGGAVERTIQLEVQRGVRKAEKLPMIYQLAGANGRWGGNGVGAPDVYERAAMALTHRLGGKVVERGGVASIPQIIEEAERDVEAQGVQDVGPELFQLFKVAGLNETLQLAPSQLKDSLLDTDGDKAAEWAADLAHDSAWYKTIKKLRNRVREPTPGGAILLQGIYASTLETHFAKRQDKDDD